MNTVKIEYRIIPGTLASKYLQFKSHIKIFGRKITVWRYIPDSYVAMVFKESDCPFLWLPFVTSHCYLSSFFETDLIEFANEYQFSLVEYFEKLKNEFLESKKITYL